MRSGLLALRAAGLVAAMVAVPVLGTTAADAHDSVKATVTPSAVRPGGEVKLKVTGCENPRSVSARSDVFVADSELAGRGALRGEAKIKSSTEDGRYEVDVWCDGHDHLGAAVFEVNHNPKPEPSPKPKPSVEPKPSTKPKSSAKPAKPSAKPSDKAEGKPASAPPAKNPKPAQSRSSKAATASASASPVAPVRAGGGGRTTSTTDLAADRAGPSTPHTVIGLVLAGVAAVAVAIRSARRKRSAARDSD